MFYNGFFDEWTAKIIWVDGIDLMTCNVRCGMFKGRGNVVYYLSS